MSIKIRCAQGMLGQLERLLLAFVLFSLVWLGGCSNFKNIRQPDSGATLKSNLTVMSFNIRHGCGIHDWCNTSRKFFKTCPKDLDVIAEAIQSVQPDVVGLQEVNESQAVELARAVNMDYTYFSHNVCGYGS